LGSTELLKINHNRRKVAMSKNWQKKDFTLSLWSSNIEGIQLPTVAESVGRAVWDQFRGQVAVDCGEAKKTYHTVVKGRTGDRSVVVRAISLKAAQGALERELERQERPVESVIGDWEELAEEGDVLLFLGKED
jgi:hypothetical protein